VGITQRGRWLLRNRVVPEDLEMQVESLALVDVAVRSDDRVNAAGGKLKSYMYESSGRRKMVKFRPSAV